jgi:hypothetical protein
MSEPAGVHPDQPADTAAGMGDAAPAQLSIPTVRGSRYIA